MNHCRAVVQDAGLIFLSRMTTDVAQNVLFRGGTASEAVATALTATAFATASMGVALVLIGKLKLARFVAYLPMPVVRERRTRYQTERGIGHSYERIVPVCVCMHECGIC